MYFSPAPDPHLRWHTISKCSVGTVDEHLSPRVGWNGSRSPAATWIGSSTRAHNFRRLLLRQTSPAHLIDPIQPSLPTTHRPAAASSHDPVWRPSKFLTAARRNRKWPRGIETRACCCTPQRTSIRQLDFDSAHHIIHSSTTHHPPSISLRRYGREARDGVPRQGTSHVPP